MPIQFTVGEHAYRTDRKINVFQQNNLLRRLLPAIGGIAAAFTESPSNPSDMAKAAGDAFLNNIEPITTAIAHMSDEDSDFVLKTCLSVVSRQSAGGTGWAKVMAPNGVLMFEDIDLAQTYMIIWKVIEENLSSFFSSLASIIPPTPPMQEAAE